jgi:multicomponent Na+:H+ antiporter subunit A
MPAGTGSWPGLTPSPSGRPVDRRITDYFEIASWPEAFGRNIVNVILVDFRALDTFGEIAVVVIAALAAYALLRGTKYRRMDPGGGQLRW